MWSYRYTQELKHYASQYYDPVAAHEYYEQHKKLKGRRSSVQLNEEGRKAADYVKKKINEERDANLKIETEKHQSESEQRQKEKSSTLERHSKVMNQRIESLRNIIKRLPADQKSTETPKMKAIISKLRDANNKKRQEIEKKYAETSAKASQKSGDRRAAIQEDASAKYDIEYNKIANEEKYQKSSKSSRRNRS